MSLNLFIYTSTPKTLFKCYFLRQMLRIQTCLTTFMWKSSEFLNELKFIYVHFNAQTLFKCYFLKQMLRIQTCLTAFMLRKSSKFLNELKFIYVQRPKWYIVATLSDKHRKYRQIWLNLHAKGKSKSSSVTQRAKFELASNECLACYATNRAKFDKLGKIFRHKYFYKYSFTLIKYFDSTSLINFLSQI